MHVFLNWFESQCIHACLNEGLDLARCKAKIHICNDIEWTSGES